MIRRSKADNDELGPNTAVRQQDIILTVPNIRKLLADSTMTFLGNTPGALT
jgi:hypothetical protein